MLKCNVCIAQCLLVGDDQSSDQSNKVDPFSTNKSQSFFMCGRRSASNTCIHPDRVGLQGHIYETHFYLTLSLTLTLTLTLTLSLSLTLTLTLTLTRILTLTLTLMLNLTLTLTQWRWKCLCFSVEVSSWVTLNSCFYRIHHNKSEVNKYEYKYCSTVFQ